MKEINAAQLIVLLGKIRERINDGEDEYICDAIESLVTPAPGPVITSAELKKYSYRLWHWIEETGLRIFKELYPIAEEWEWGIPWDGFNCRRGPKDLKERRLKEIDAFVTILKNEEIQSSKDLGS